MSHKPTKHIIAYLDFLGTTKRIENEKDNSHLEFIINSFTEISQIIEKNNKSNRTHNYLTKLKYRSFSDNILFVISANESKMLLADAFDLILELVSMLCFKAIQNGKLVRGGITIGNIYVDNFTAYGKGLLRAINLEEDIAYYPRVLVDNSIEDYLNKEYLESSKTLLDSDSLRFVNIFRHAHIKNEDLQSLQEILIQLYIKEQGNIKNMAKVMWLCKYYKSYIEQYNNSFMWIGTKEIQLSEQFLSLITSHNKF